MDPLSILSGVISIIAVALHSARLTKEFIDAIEDAPRAVALISSDLASLGGVLQALNDLMTISDTSTSTSKARLAPLLKAPVENCTSICADIRLAIKPFVKPSGNAKMSKWRSFTWNFREKEIQELQSVLLSYKSSLDIALGVANISNTQAETLIVTKEVRSLRKRVDADRESIADSSFLGSEDLSSDYGFALKRFLLKTESLLGDPESSSVLDIPEPVASLDEDSMVLTQQQVMLQQLRQTLEQMELQQVERLQLFPSSTLEEVKSTPTFTKALAELSQQIEMLKERNYMLRKQAEAPREQAMEGQVLQEDETQQYNRIPRSLSNVDKATLIQADQIKIPQELPIVRQRLEVLQHKHTIEQLQYQQQQQEGMILRSSSTPNSLRLTQVPSDEELQQFQVLAVDMEYLQEKKLKAEQKAQQQQIEGLLERVKNAQVHIEKTHQNRMLRLEEVQRLKLLVRLPPYSLDWTTSVQADHTICLGELAMLQRDVEEELQGQALSRRITGQDPIWFQSQLLSQYLWIQDKLEKRFGAQQEKIMKQNGKWQRLGVQLSDATAKQLAHGATNIRGVAGAQAVGIAQYAVVGEESAI